MYRKTWQIQKEEKFLSLRLQFLFEAGKHTLIIQSNCHKHTTIIRLCFLKKIILILFSSLESLNSYALSTAVHMPEPGLDSLHNLVKMSPDSIICAFLYSYLFLHSPFKNLCSSHRESLFPPKHFVLLIHWHKLGIFVSWAIYVSFYFPKTT